MKKGTKVSIEIPLKQNQIRYLILALNALMETPLGFHRLDCESLHKKLVQYLKKYRKTLKAYENLQTTPETRDVS